MAKIIAVHSFRGGTGKSNTIANIAALLALRGKRVGVVDTDLQSPGIHVLFGMDEDRMTNTLNDYLKGKCDIQQATYDVTGNLNGNINGRIYLIPSSIKAGDIVRMLREGYDVGLLNDGFTQIIHHLDLDVLVIDTHPGLNEETLLSIAISDAVVIVLRPDHQDYQGTGVAVEVARKLDVPRMMLIVNKIPQQFKASDVKARVEQTYDTEVAAVVPHSDELMSLASAGIFSLKYPGHPITEEWSHIVEKLFPEFNNHR